MAYTNLKMMIIIVINSKLERICRKGISSKEMQKFQSRYTYFLLREEKN